MRRRLLAALLAGLLAPACDGTSTTEVRIDLLFADGQSPLERAERLEVTVLEPGVDPRALDPVTRPEGGWAGLDVGVSLGAVTIESATVRLEGRDGGDRLVCLGESVAIPLAVGRPGSVVVLLAETGASGAIPGLDAPAAEHAAVYLERGGLLVAGGSGGAAVTVYALDAYEPVEVAAMPSERSLAAGVAIDGGRALVIGGEEGGGEAFVYAPADDEWETVDLPGEVSGSWPRPAVSRAPSGATVAARGRWVVRLGTGTSPEAELLGALPEGVEAGTLTATSDDRAVALGGGEPAAAAIDLGSGEPVAVPEPPSGPRTGHAAIALEDGRLVVLGGEGAEGLLESVEVLDADGESWQLRADLLEGHGRSGAAAVLLDDGRIALAGGQDAEGRPLADALVIDLDAGVVETIPLAEPRSGATATLLPWGAILVVGGRGADGEPLASAEALLPSP